MQGSKTTRGEGGRGGRIFLGVNSAGLTQADIFFFFFLESYTINSTSTTTDFQIT